SRSGSCEARRPTTPTRCGEPANSPPSRRSPSTMRTAPPTTRRISCGCSSSAASGKHSLPERPLAPRPDRAALDQPRAVELAEDVLALPAPVDRRRVPVLRLRRQDVGAHEPAIVPAVRVGEDQELAETVLAAREVG